MRLTSKFTATEKRKEAEREVAMRKRVYGRLSKVSASLAERDVYSRQIALMQEIAEDYRAQEGPPAQGILDIDSDVAD